MMSRRRPVILIQTDFGESDSGILHLFGVCKSVCADAQVYNLRNDIPKFSIPEAARSLKRAMGCWPEETVFVSAIVDPEVKSACSMCVAKSRSQQYIVAADNGTISSAVADRDIEWIRDLSDLRQRYIDLERTEVCHGREFAYCAAQVARQLPEVSLGTLLFENKNLE